MIPDNPHHAFLVPHRNSTISEDYLMTDRMSMECKNASSKFTINEMCVYRIDLPSYPQIWTEPLLLEIELLVLIDPVCKTILP